MPDPGAGSARTRRRAARGTGSRLGSRVSGSCSAWLPQPLLQLVAVGDVLDHRHRVHGRAVGVADQRDGEVGPHDVPVAVPVALLHPASARLPAMISR